ncbi:acyltransferase [Mucilaginibacter sp. PAMB04168]|uniref:acyltransferase family protein n=1 Tax=Mucilaginibacter sp. PAMB04168 TaxID=3138567 RepID=UPI0031F63BA4
MVKISATIDSVQVMRAFAAVSVLFFHGTHIIDNKLNFLFLNNFFDAGYSGVDVFFVISGFIILHTCMGKDFNAFTFLKKRFVRIYPVYWVVTLAVIIAYQIAPEGVQPYKEDWRIILGSLALVPQKIYIIGIAWTLTFELLFYVVFAVAYSIGKKFLFAVLFVWAAVILALYAADVKPASVALNMLVNPIIIEFFFGCLIAYFYNRYREFKYHYILSTIGFIWFAVNWVIYWTAKNNDADAFSTYISRVYLFGVPAAILISGIVFYKKSIAPLFVYIGNASYSLYLIHGTVISILIKILFVLKIQTYFANNIGSVAILLATVLIGCAFYRFVEAPIIGLFKSKKGDKPASATSVTSATV